MQSTESLPKSIESEKIEWLREFRKKSFEKFEQLPSENTELFKYQTFFRNFDFSEFNFESEKENEIKFLGPDSIVIEDLSHALREKEFRDLLVTGSEEDKFFHLNNAIFSSGIYIKVPKNTKIDEPVRLISNLKNHNFTKIFVSLEENSSMKLIKEDYSENDKPIIASEAIEFILKDNSELVFSNVQNFSENVLHFSHMVSNLFNGSKISLNSGFFGANKVRSRSHVRLIGNGSTAENLEAVFGGKQQNFDLYTNLDHIGKHTVGKSLSKSVMKDSSSSIVKGMIKIGKDAKNSNSFLALHAILLDREAKSNTIPGLEIGTNDVKATHSASVSQIDGEKIFYLMSRGLSLEEARKTIVIGFFDPIVRRFSLEETRDKLLGLIEMKWGGEEQRFKKLSDPILHKEGEQSKEADIFEGHYKYR